MDEGKRDPVSGKQGNDPHQDNTLEPAWQRGANIPEEKMYTNVSPVDL